MDDNFFYRDLAGKRHLRSYLKASILIVIFMALALAWGFWDRAQRMAVVNAPARPVVWEPTPTPIPPTATPTATPEPCPTNPSDWEFFHPYPGYEGNLHKIGPACVYEGLERTAAWVLLASSMGYSGDEAAEALGFAEMPFKPVRTMQIMTDYKGPMDMGMSYPPLNPAIRIWFVDDNGKPSLSFTLRGCFRARSIVGLQVDEWGLYPVMCVVSGDYDNSYFGAEMGDHRGTENSNNAADPVRVFFVFGYSGSGLWNFIGYQGQPIVRLSEMQDQQGDRKFMSDSHGVSVWDAAWVESAFGVAPRPMFDGWQTYVNNESDKAAITKAAKDFRERAYDSP